MSKLRVQVEKDGAVVRWVLNAPRANLLDNDMVEALRGAASDVGAGVKAVVVEGAGEHFSYGASVHEHRPGEIEAALPRFHALFCDLLDLARPLVAVVRGNCLGGGLELAAFCNWIFASPDARFGLPEIRLGVFAPLGSIVLRERVGRPVAEMLCVTGRVLGADEALEAGLVDGVAEEPDAAADAWIEANLLPHSAAALHHAIRAVRAPLAGGFRRDLAAVEKLYLEDLMRTEDAREGIEAFLAKRKPQWKNR